MIRALVSNTLPDWIEISSRTSISRLLERLLDKDVVHVDVTFWDGIAFIILTEQHGSVSYCYLRRREWDIVDHIIHRDPVFCKCWACHWRLRRGRYLNPQKFYHLYRS